MPTRFYNTLAHELQTFTPLTPGPNPANPFLGADIKIYTCGPTVYDYAHIGNFRAFLFADLLRRFLEFKGATVHQVMNMTDVGHMTDDSHADPTGEDKMALAQRKLKESKKTGTALIDNPDDPHAVAQFFVDAFLSDARQLQLKIVQQYDAAPSVPPITNYQLPITKSALMPRPTQFIPQFISMIEKLIATNHAYLAPDGVVYYNVSSFPSYGQLSGNSLDQLSHGAGGRTADSAAKKNPADFFLWKPDPSHLMRWPSPWGEGYPGWHIECSAMATQLLGPSLDIHTGGEDNIFPHHECEIAQSEAATGKTFSHFWMHTRHLLVNGQKMSKSKGNFFTIRDLTQMGGGGYDPLAIRLALINTRYRESMDFSLRSLHEAASALTTLRDLADKLTASITPLAPGLPGVTPLTEQDQKMLTDFTAALDDDLNASAALAALFTWSAPLLKQKKIPPDQAASALAALQKIDHVLAVIFPPLRPLSPELTQKVESLLAQRTAARTAKDWPKSDALRAELASLNIEIKDTPTATTWRTRLAPAILPES